MDSQEMNWACAGLGAVMGSRSGPQPRNGADAAVERFGRGRSQTMPNMLTCN